MADRVPFSQPFDLASFGEAEKTIAMQPSEAERAAIASWAGIDALVSFAASVRLRRTGTDTYQYEGAFAADVTQSCVVTLAPVQAHLEGAASREFRVVAQRSRRRARDDEALDSAADEETEVLSSHVLDLAGPILEEFALAIDPYPRAPDAEFTPPDDSAKPSNPFSALEKLKGKG